ncbi:cytochrome c oxidase subunit 5B, mitochondrial-like [Xenia sp. Carnegie-2017]|uniref:cytochrome c oxidase subunit 5B, mitochondrial-like n=1 Tax=Xenia sp. Carnegie-2017 TaxID=2897299 RepID=UPI001F04A975|nr:cytochrome c oxidase subunit 5B, mitochondrial-like [Xenia sp. Carnegie-2017]
MAYRLLTSSFRSLCRVPAASQLRVSTAAMTKRMASADQGGIAQDEDQVTGPEKRELEKHMEGDMDPYNLKVYSGPGGTKDNPIKVPSMEDERIVGCISEEDMTYIEWFTLKKGKPQRSDSGIYFELVPGLPYNFDH